jgi:hypothetical protein
MVVNVATTADQLGPAVTIGADNGFVVAWTDSGHDGDGFGVFARLFTANGVAITDDIPVNTTTTGNQIGPVIASDALGNFVVVWSSYPDSTGGADVFARRFDAAGVPQGPEFMVNTYTTGYQWQPDVAMDSSGEFVVVWTSEPAGAQPPQDGDAAGIYARRYDAGGNALGSEFLVNTTTTGSQLFPTVAMESSPRFVVVWVGPGAPGNGGTLFGQLYDEQGDPDGGEFPVSSPTEPGSSDYSQPDVAWNRGSFEFVVASERWIGSGPWNVVGRMFYGFGTPFGEEFVVNTDTLGQHLRPKVAAGVAGPRPANFVVTWETLGQDDPGNPSQGGVFAQRFANTPFGTAAFFLAVPPRQGSEYQINTYTTGEQRRPDVAVDQRGQFVVAWDSDGEDGSGYGVLSRRFGFPDAQPAKVDQSPSGGASNVNGVLEPGERVVIDTAWHNTSQDDFQLQGTLDNITGPLGPAYTIDDPTANYGMIVAGFTKDCASNGDCYEVTVSGVRPGQHWDVTVDETLSSPGPLLAPPLARVKTWALHVGGSFPDVPESEPFYAFIENIFHNRVTAGGACSAGSYCSEDFVLRQQMAVFLLKSIYGADFVPPAATGAVFDDVPASSPFAPWIEELFRESITAGCTAPPPPALPSFCPSNAVTRQQMAVFLLKTLLGSNYAPPACAGIFDDVPCGPPAASYVEDLYSRGIAAGCSASPLLYCPADATKRKQMAAFLVKTFGLQLYGPD